MSRRGRMQWYLSSLGSVRRCRLGSLASPRVNPRVRRLRVEPLEERWLLANVTVGNLNDVVNGTTTSIAALIAAPGADGISLREAILAANADAAADVIDFAPAVTGTIQLTNVGHVGEIAITNDLTINGPGASLLTIRAFAGTAAAGDGARIFSINDGTFFDRVVTLTGLTLTGGDSNTSGGAISNAENLTLNGCTITGNGVAVGGGGGIHQAFGTLTVTASTLSGNTALRGGGIYVTNFSATIRDSAITGNLATGTFINNDGGGGIFLKDNGSGFGGESITVISSTISGNQANTHGGGIMNTSRTFSGQSAVTVRHSTITGNRADADNSGAGSGGGIHSTFVDATTIDHTIVAGNFRMASTRSDLGGVATVARYSLIGDNTDATITDNGGNQIGTGAAPIDPLLGPLANNGGPTLTHQLLVGSPAIEAGDLAAVAGVGTVPLFDQRGTPQMRIFDGNVDSVARIDIGAIELQFQLIVVDTLNDENDGDVSAGDLSLREAIIMANASATANTIGFSPTLISGGPATIVLTRGVMAISDQVTISGPGANLLTISGNNTSRIFNTVSAPAGSAIVLQGLAFTAGFVSGLGGGAIAVGDEALTLKKCTVTNCSADSGGAILIGFDGSLLIEDSTLSGNSATGNGFFSDGGAIFAGSSTPVTIRRSILSGNTAADEGGAISLVSSTSLTVEDSTLSGNIANSTFASYGGGAIQFHGSQIIGVISNSTLSGNSAPTASGGAIGFVASSGGAPSSLEIKNCTITGNMAGVNGGGIARTGGTAVVGVTLRNTILAGNTNASTPDLSFNIATNIGGSHNLVGVAGVGNFTLTGTGNQSGTLAAPLNPLLGVLASNGGPTKTHALLVGSPAIDAGNPAAVAGAGGVPLFDQRGAPLVRVFDGDGVGGARIDIGAFELQPTGPALPGDYNVDESVDASDYVVWRKTLGASVAPPFTGADGDGDSTIDPGDYDVWSENFGEALPGSGGADALGQETRAQLVANVDRAASENLPKARPGLQRIGNSYELTSERPEVRRSTSVLINEPARWQERALLAWLASHEAARARQVAQVDDGTLGDEESEPSIDAIGESVDAVFELSSNL